MRETRISVAQARKNFAKVLSRAAKEGARIKVTRYRTTLAGIVPGKDLAHLKDCDKLITARRATKRRANKSSSARRVVRRR